METKEPFKRREWLGVILLITLAQAFFWYFVSGNAGNMDVINYFAFAGTLISIILAVLAIGYTYGESIKDKGKSDALEEQIKALRIINEKIKGQAEALDEIEVIKTNLGSIVDKVEGSVNETRTHFSGVFSRLDLLTGQSRTNNTQGNPIRVTGLDKDEVAESILVARSPLIEINLLFIMISAQENSNLKDSIQKQFNIRTLIEDSIKNLHQNIGVEVEMITYINLFSGGIHSLISCFQGLGLMNEFFVMDDILVKKIKATIFPNPLPSGEFYTALIHELISQIK